MTPQDRRQTEALLRAIDDVVSTRTAGMHPRLIYLFDMAQSMRNYMSGDPALPAPRTVLDADLAADLAVALPDLFDTAEEIRAQALGWLDDDPTDACREEHRADYQRVYEEHVGTLAAACRRTLTILGADG